VDANAADSAYRQYSYFPRAGIDPHGYRLLHIPRLWEERDFRWLKLQVTGKRNTLVRNIGIKERYLIRSNAYRLYCAGVARRFPA
jgi:hypothetical protein